MIQVDLTPAEILQGSIVGIRRRVTSLNFKQAEDGAVPNWSGEIEGALAEMAVAKHLGAWFDPNMGKYKSKDVGIYHVRHTELPNGCLIIRPNDPDGLYMLVIGSFGRYQIVGVISSEEARKLTQYSKGPNDRPTALFIPQRELAPLSEVTGVVIK